MEIERLRAQIPATARTIYMNTGWSGPSPQPVVEVIQETLAEESAEGPTSPSYRARRGTISIKARETAARFLGAMPEEMVLTANTTQGLNIVLQGLPWRRRDEVITYTVEHSSLLVPLLYLRRRHGIRVRMLHLGAQETPEAILTRLEEAFTARTRLVALSHIQYTTGQVMPLAEIHALAHAHGVPVLVDGAQSAGHLPLDMRALDADYYAWPGHKWVLGPDGVGALYVRRELLEALEPRFMAGSAALSYDRRGRLAPRSDRPQKFELTTSSGALLAGFTAALGFLEEVGSQEIWERNRALSALARARLAAIRGVTIVSPLEGPLTTGLVAFAVRGVSAPRVTAALWNRGQVVARSVRYPEPATRLSLHFFNTEEEVERVAELVEGVPGRRR